jgi:hypothetical protein
MCLFISGVTINTQPPVELTSDSLLDLSESSTESSNIQVDLIFPVPKSKNYF